MTIDEEHTPAIAALIDTANKPFYYWSSTGNGDADQTLMHTLKRSLKENELVGCAIVVDGTGLPRFDDSALMGITVIDRVLGCNLAWWLVTVDRASYVMFEDGRYVLMPIDKEREHLFPWLVELREKAAAL